MHKGSFMIQGAWGKKLGMSQRFVDDKVVPVTAIEINNWYITGHRLQERDGYDAVQIGLIKKKYEAHEFSSEWIKKAKKHLRLKAKQTLCAA